jgi:hypothetical protein
MPHTPHSQFHFGHDTHTHIRIWTHHCLYPFTKSAASIGVYKAF